MPVPAQELDDIPPAGVFKGDALRWTAIARTNPGQRFTARALVGDWDGDGVDEVLLPAISSGNNEVPIPLGRSAVYELDGSASLAPLNGFMLGRESMAWDYDRDGFPEIVTDIYDYATVEVTRRTREVMTHKDSSRRAEFEKSESEANAIRKQLTALKPGSNGYFDRADELFSRLDSVEMLFDGLEYREFTDWDEYNAAMGGITVGLEPPAAIVLNLSGRKIGEVDGNFSDDPASKVANVIGSSWPEIVAWEFQEQDADSAGNMVKLFRFFGKNGQIRGTFQETQDMSLICLADLNGDSLMELLTFALLPNALNKQSFVLQSAGVGGKPIAVDLTGAAVQENYAWPAACFDLDGDGTDEILSADWQALNTVIHREYILEKPESWNGIDRRPDATTGMTHFALSSKRAPLAWIATQSRYFPTGIAAYRSDGRLEYFQEFGDELLLVATANGPDGVPYLLVQTASRLLAWPQDGQRQTGMQANAGLCEDLSGRTAISTI